MDISIIGSGYVGLVTGSCLAELGNKVIFADSDSKKISSLKKGIVPIFEPGLRELIMNNVKKKRIIGFTTNIKDAVKRSKIIFVTVSTPPLENGELDLSYLENVARHIAVNMNGYKLIVDKSTVPVDTGERVKRTISTYIRKKVEFDVASNPEFLSEGSAINDFMRPDRIVIGAESKKAKDMLADLYKPLNAPILITDIKSAELIKHASNAFLATKISFINGVSNVCEKVGADIKEVSSGIGLDKRIGSAFLNAGLGYGGSCFPKDLNSFIKIAEKAGYNFELLKSVRNINEEQKELFLKKIGNALWVVKGKTIAVLGLSFKPGTDDMRNAPSLDIIKSLRRGGAKLKLYDPQAMKKAKKILNGKDLKFCSDPYEACRGSDCLVIITEWSEFKELDFKKIKKLLKTPLIFDGRNIYEPKNMGKLGFTYIGIGRASH